MGQVPRNTLSMDVIVMEITKNNPGIGKFAVYHSAELIKEEIMSQIATGCAMSVLDLGTVYIGVSGKIEGSDPTPADIMYADESPVINTTAYCTAEQYKTTLQGEEPE